MTRLTGNFTKRSNIGIIYMCYKRVDLIRAAIPALFKSEGLDEYDVFISQDGGSGYVVELPQTSSVNVRYLRHPFNLSPGQHHYFVKSFAFDIMGYESLIVVEEDNMVHPDAIKMLREMLELSINMPTVGLVSIVDMDNSLLVDDKHNASVRATGVDVGHLWVFGLHSSRYKAVRGNLRDYFDVIKGRDYRFADLPPLRDDIMALHARKGLVGDLKMSQDSFFVFSLMKAGFTQRLTTMVRLFSPMGWKGLHFQGRASYFYGIFGRGMFQGRIKTPAAFIDTRKNSTAEALKRDALWRLEALYQRYLARVADEGAIKETMTYLLDGRLNAVELAKNILDSAEHLNLLKTWLRDGFTKGVRTG